MTRAFCPATATKAQLSPGGSRSWFTRQLFWSDFRAAVRTAARAPCTMTVRRLLTPSLADPKQLRAIAVGDHTGNKA